MVPDTVLQIPGLSLHDHLTADAVPEAPGLYAWYPRVQLQAADCAGVHPLSRALSALTATFDPPPIGLRGQDRFQQSWNGALTAERPTPPDLGSTVKPADLAAVGKLLNGAGALFQSPLYIGESRNLATRVRYQHFAALERYSSRLSDSPDYAEALAHTKPTFATRAALAGYTHRGVMVCCLDASAFLGDDAEDWKTLLKASEWFLNRWARPKLGET